MKRLNNIGCLMVAFAMALLACEPIEDRLELKNSFDPEKIELKVVQPSTGSNKLSIQMNTPGVVGFWDYGIDRGFTDRVEVVYPIPGTHTFTFYVTNGYLPGNDLSEVEYVSKSIEVKIDKLDYELPASYYRLVGEELQSKTWVFDRSNPDMWWYMTDADWTAFWWQPDLGDCPDADGEMVFDLKGGANFTYYSAPDAEAVSGSTWGFNKDYTKLTIKGDANILGVAGGAENNTGSKEYQVLELTDERLVLFQSDMVWSPGWVWVFMAKSNPT